MSEEKEAYVRKVERIAKVTVVCPDHDFHGGEFEFDIKLAGNFYGEWRDSCPECGTALSFVIKGEGIFKLKKGKRGRTEGQFRITLQSENGEEILGGEFMKNKADALDSMETVRRIAPGAKYVDETV